MKRIGRLMDFGIWNLINDWSPKSKSSGRDWNSVRGIRDPWRGIWNARQSWIPLHVMGRKKKHTTKRNG